MSDRDVRRALNSLYEQRRTAARGLELAKRNKDRVGEQRQKREIDRLDGEIANLNG
ncbi:hypothetical protein SEA_TARGARYEN_28 [Streptomyces phage Targaryen]|nr:hypothetical protein SEA_TARGARYEN_28 [Streptomyces phage Targaryen]